MKPWKSSQLDARFIEDLLEWGRAKTQGGLTFREAEPTKEFWGWWRESAESFKRSGVWVSKDDDDNWIVRWRNVGSALPERPEPEIHVASVRPGNWHLADCRELLRPYQVPAVGTLMQAVAEHQFALDASETGLGKTYVAMAVARLLKINFAVVCPANAVSKWIDVAIDFELEPEFVLSYDKLRTGNTDYVSRGTIVRWGKTKPKFVWNTCDQVLLIFDEVHSCSGWDSLNSALLKGAIDNPQALVIGCSATAANSPLNMEVLGYGLGLHQFSNFWDWCRDVGAREGLYGGLAFDARPGSRAERELKRIHAKVFPERGVRLTRSELGAELPKDEIIVEQVDLTEVEITPKMALALKALESKEVADAEKAAKKELETSALVTTTRERQRCEILKSPMIAEKASLLVAEGRSVAIFVHYSETISLLNEMFSREIPLAHLVGGMGQRRDEAISRFQHGHARVIICQSQAGSTSIDLHNLHNNWPRASIICPGHSAVQLLQALGRINRSGSFDQSTLQYLMFAAEGVEQRAARSVQKKLNNLALLNDGDLEGMVAVV